MKTYTPNLTGLTIISNPQKQNELFFFDGHPKFLIPDFNAEPTDIWISYEDYIDKRFGKIYDQNGGEILSHKIINQNGLTLVEYVLYDISLESNPDDYKEYNITIEGYVVDDGNDVYFLATKVTGDI
jgi:hypothetical protein